MRYDLGGLLTSAAFPLRLPSVLRERVHRYVRQHQGSAAISEQAPFRRQIDLWAAGIAVACGKRLTPRPGPSTDWGEKFVDTRGVQLDGHLAELLVTLAAAEYGIKDPRIGDGAEVIELANRYAAVGVPVLLEWLEDAGLRQTNMEKLMTGLKSLHGLSDGTAEALTA